MNEFYDIGTQNDLSEDSYQLKDLGHQKILISASTRVRGGWGEQDQYERSNVYTAVTAEDYDHQFVSKLLRVRPSYKIETLINHHFHFYLSKHPGLKEEFLNHMRYEVFPLIKKRSNNESYTELFEKWINDQTMGHEKPNSIPTINNTINVGNVNAPLQLQQNSNHSVQTQNNHLPKEDMEHFFEILKKDIKQVDENIRKDFLMEIDYTLVQIERERDIKPQMLNIGELIKDVGVNTFANLLAAPIFEVVKPLLGL